MVAAARSRALNYRAGNAEFILDDAAFQVALAHELTQLGVRTEQDLLRLALKIQNEARRFAPVDTGRLRSSIQHSPGRDPRGFYVDVGTNVKYAPHVEFGTQHMPPQPYLRPALLKAARLWAQEVSSR